MAEDTARALGAGSRTVTVAGKECTVRPLTVKELAEIERECLESYRRSYLKTFSANADLLPESDRVRTLREQMETAARWDVDDLPPKHAHDAAGVKLTDRLRRWLEDKFGAAKDDARLRTLCASALDQGMLSAREYRSMTGARGAPRLRVPYVSWWITGSMEGMVTMIWTCFRDAGVTKDDVLREVSSNPAMLAELSREIEQVSAPTAGNP